MTKFESFCAAFIASVEEWQNRHGIVVPCIRGELYDMDELPRYQVSQQPQCCGNCKRYSMLHGWCSLTEGTKDREHDCRIGKFEQVQ